MCRENLFFTLEDLSVTFCKHVKLKIATEITYKIIKIK